MKVSFLSFNSWKTKIIFFYEFRSAHDEGWIFKVKLADRKELDGLMEEEAYSAYLKTQEEDLH